MNQLIKKILQVLMDYLFPLLIEALEEWLRKKIEDIHFAQEPENETTLRG
jgi:hypothetical protein